MIILLAKKIKKGARLKESAVSSAQYIALNILNIAQKESDGYSLESQYLNIYIISFKNPLA